MASLFDILLYMNRYVQDQQILKVVGIPYQVSSYGGGGEGLIANILMYTDVSGKEVTNYYEPHTGKKMLPKHLWEFGEALTKEQNERPQAND